MDEDIETLVVRVRADRQGLARDVEAMRGEMEGPLSAGAARAGLKIEQGLLRAVRTGKLGFEDLKRVALSALDAIATSALRGVMRGGSGGSGDGGLLGAGVSLLGTALGLPGRATGGPVAPGRAYMVGERGPELFVPTTSGQVVTQAGGGARDVRVAIAIHGNGGESDARMLARSARQVARAVKGAIGG